MTATGAVFLTDSSALPILFARCSVAAKDRLFSFSRYGKSYLIDIIYDSPLLPPKKRKDINARKMSLSDYFKHLITTFFYKKGKDCFKNYTELCDVLYLKHKTGDRREIQLQKLKNYYQNICLKIIGIKDL